MTPTKASGTPASGKRTPGAKGAASKARSGTTTSTAASGAGRSASRGGKAKAPGIPANGAGPGVAAKGRADGKGISKKNGAKGAAPRATGKGGAQRAVTKAATRRAVPTPTPRPTAANGPKRVAGASVKKASRSVGRGPAGSVKAAAAKPLRAVGRGPYADDTKFLQEQQALLESERRVYQGQAFDLKAEADSLAQEREPGDVQFDEESGEGGTVTVDRERDLALSAQALQAVEEIDDAIARVKDRTYGACERCHQPIPKPRLRALPYARLCVACKSGGLSRR